MEALVPEVILQELHKMEAQAVRVAEVAEAVVLWEQGAQEIRPLRPRHKEIMVVIVF